ncbi:MAG: serine/threonine-protein kinase [Planctomycetota bacterium]|jgi:serine/threonine-protein kinase
MAKSGTLQLKDVLKGYWVGQRLGSGARSVIYEVKRKSDGALFGVKFIPVRGDEDLRVIGHLENEFRVLSAIQEKRTTGVNIAVRVEEFEKIKRLFKVRAAYLVMERLRGRALSDYYDYSPDQVLTIFRQVCLGIEHTHDVGYVHADMKPQNILVGENLDVKLIDFGFAAPVGQELNSYKGTFGYLAPEQAGGRLSEKTDVFNVGAALYWVLTGQNIPSIMPGQHEAIGFVPDSGVSITPPSRINPKVPQELSDMVLRCCRSKEHERPTVRELKQYLHGLQLRLDYGTV